MTDLIPMNIADNIKYNKTNQNLHCEYITLNGKMYAKCECGRQYLANNYSHISSKIHQEFLKDKYPDEYTGRSMYFHNYYENNKIRIIESMMTKVQCECGELILKGSLSTHKKTMKHINRTTC